MSTSTPAATTPVLPHVQPGDLITSELINAIIDLLAPPDAGGEPDLTNLPEITNVSNSALASLTINLRVNKEVTIEGANLSDVYLIRFDSLPIALDQVTPTPDSITIPFAALPDTAPRPLLPDNDNFALGLVSVTNATGTANRVILYSGV